MCVFFSAESWVCCGQGMLALSARLAFFSVGGGVSSGLGVLWARVRSYRWQTRWLLEGRGPLQIPRVATWVTLLNPDAAPGAVGAEQHEPRGATRSIFGFMVPLGVIVAPREKNPQEGQQSGILGCATSHFHVTLHFHFMCPTVSEKTKRDLWLRP